MPKSVKKDSNFDVLKSGCNFMTEMPQNYPFIKRIILECVYLLLSCGDNQQMHTTVLNVFWQINWSTIKGSWQQSLWAVFISLNAALQFSYNFLVSFDLMNFKFSRHELSMWIISHDVNLTNKFWNFELFKLKIGSL